MKLIFLDVDGVLNYGGCKARSATGCLGVEDEKEDSAKKQLIEKLYKIAELEKVEITDEAIDAEYNTIASAYNVDVDYAKANLPAEEIRHSLTIRAALDAVKATAKVTYLESAPAENDSDKE